MLDFSKILKRAWHILWNVRVLWVFGYILAVAVGGTTFSRSGTGYQYGSRDTVGPLDLRVWPSLQIEDIRLGWQELLQSHPQEYHLGLSLLITFLLVVLLMTILLAVVRHVAEAAAIRVVNDYQDRGKVPGFRQAWQMGWSRTAWRLFLINLLVSLPVLFFVIVIGLLAWWFIASLPGGSDQAILTSLFVGVGLTLLLGAVTGVAMVILYVVRDFAWRKCALQDLGVVESLRQGNAMIWRQWQSVGLTWLIMLGLRIAWEIILVILIVPMLLLSVVTLLVGLAMAIVPGLLAAGIASLFVPDYWPWFYALVISFPFFYVVAFAPLFLVNGWALIFRSSVWTLAYNDLAALEAPKAKKKTVRNPKG